MNYRRGLIGLFSTIFLLSALSMIMLVIDERKDLSSRASGWLSNNLREAIPDIRYAPNEIIWDGNQYKLPVVINFRESLWMSPKDKDAVFYHRQLPITIRVTSESVDQEYLRSVLGKNFIYKKTIEKKQLVSSVWTIQSHIYDFLGVDKSVDVWTGKNNISIITVKPISTVTSDIEDFTNGIKTDILDGQVRGTTSEDDTVRLAALVRPSVVLILNNYCSKVRFENVPSMVLTGREYPFCVTSVGSGFFVNKDGYIATNGHVVKNIPSSSLFNAVVSGSLDTLLSDYMQVYTAQKTGTLPIRQDVELQIKESHSNKENIYQFAALVDDLLSRKYLALDTPGNKYYVQLGNTPLQFTSSGVVADKSIVEATIVDSDYSEPDKVTGFSGSDVALLKVEGNNFPGLPLGNIDDLAVGSNIQIIGFPGLVMGSNSFLLDTSANAEPTFTKGVVSALKLARGNQKRLIQTDASVNHGSSGGPAISSSGNVIGIATYGLTPEEGSGNFNFIRDINDLKLLMKKNNITEDVGDTYKLWKSGLDSYWLSYFQYAKNDLEKLSSLYPVHPLVEKYLDVSRKKVNTSEDQTPKFTRNARIVYMNLSGGVMSLSLLSVLIIWIIDETEKKKKQQLMV